MVVIGLTGGIGCGKTTVCDYFIEQNIAVIDADIVNRQLLKQTTTIAKIQKVFPHCIKGGQVDRVALRDTIFTNAKLRQQLEAIMHPLIRIEISNRLQYFKEQQHQLVILCVPLLLQSDFYRQLCDKTVVVDCPVERQIERVIQRDALSEQQVNQILAAQMSRQQRIQLADDIIDNSQSIEQMRKQVLQLIKQWKL